MTHLPRIDRRAFVVGTAAIGSGLALGFDIPFGGPGVVRSADGAPEVNAWVVIRPDDTVVIRIARSPVIELNRAVAVGMAEGPQAGLAIVERMAHEPALQNYHLLSGVRGDLLQKLGCHDEARAAFEAAAALAGSLCDRNLMLRRARENL